MLDVSDIFIFAYIIVYLAKIFIFNNKNNNKNCLFIDAKIKFMLLFLKEK